MIKESRFEDYSCKQNTIICKDSATIFQCFAVSLQYR